MKQENDWMKKVQYSDNKQSTSKAVWINSQLSNKSLNWYKGSSMLMFSALTSVFCRSHLPASNIFTQHTAQ